MADLGISRRALERHFQADLGLSPHAAGLRVRLGQAGHLLRSSDRTVAAVAAQTGFADASHLVRAFRTEYGQTPSEWRQTGGS